MIWLTSALAGGYFYSDSGIRATGRGGAWIAGADSQFAQYHNPAGLIRVKRPTFNLGLGHVQQNVSFERRNEDGDLLPPAENQAPPFLVPQLGFATPLINDKLALGFGIVSPYAPSSQYDPNGAGRYSVVDTDIYEFSWGPSVAWRPHPVITVGVSLQAHVLWLEQGLVVSASGTDDPAADIGVRANVRDGFTPSANIGLLIDPHPAVTIGLAAQPGIRYRAKGSAELDLTAGNLGAVADGDIDVFRDGDCDPDDDTVVCGSEDGIGLDLRLPWTLRAGIAVRPVERFEIEAAVVWQNWATLDAITLSGIDPEIRVFGSPAAIDNEFALPAGLRNTASFRLGAEWTVDDAVRLRAGGFYENGSQTSETLNVSLVDPWKAQIGCGFTIRGTKRLTLDGAFAGLVFPTVDVQTSGVRQVFVDVLGTGAQPTTVGNGVYRSSGFIAGLQANFALGAER